MWQQKKGGKRGDVTPSEVIKEIQGVRASEQVPFEGGENFGAGGQPHTASNQNFKFKPY